MKINHILLISLLIVGIFVPAVSAEIIIDEQLREYVDTSSTANLECGGNYCGGHPRILRFKAIENYPELSYIVVDIPNAGPYDVPLGRSEFTYYFNGKNRPGVIYKSQSTNFLGVITNCKLTLFLNDWDIGELSGPQTIELPFYKDRDYWVGTAKSTKTTPVYLHAEGYTKYGITGTTTYTVASSIPWKNDIKVSNTSNEISGYDITLTRTIDDKPYTSTLEISKNSDLIYFSNYHGTFEELWFPKTDINNIAITSPSGQIYSYLLDGDTPGDPGDPGDPGAQYQFSIPSIQPGSAVPVLWTGDPFTVTFDCSSEAFADVDFISYTFGSPEYYRTNQQSGDGSWSAYKRVGADWFEYNHDTYEFSIPSSAAQARAHTFPGPRLGPDDDNAYKFLGVARAGLGNEVCDQTTYVRVDGPPVAPDASWTGLRVYLWDASSGDLIGQTAQISILHPSGTEIAAASTSNGWVELKIPRPDPWDPSFRYRVQATVSGYQQTDDVYVLPLAIYPAYEVAEVRLYPDSAGPDDPGAGILQFYISDQATGRPIPGARLEVRGPTGPAHLKIVNNQGTARLELPGNLTYSYRIEADGYAGISGTIYLTAGGTSTVRQGLTTGWPTDPPHTQPPGGIPDEDDDSDSFMMQAVRGIANLFGVSFGIGKNILGMLLALGIGTATAKHLRGGAQEFGMGMLGGVVLGVLIGLLPIWVLVLLVLIVGLWIGQRYMSGGDS